MDCLFIRSRLGNFLAYIVDMISPQFFISFS